MATGPLAAGIRRPLAAGIALILSAATLTTAQTAVASPSQKKGSLIHSATGNQVRVAYKGGNYSAPRKKVGAGGSAPATGHKPRYKLEDISWGQIQIVHKEDGLAPSPIDGSDLEPHLFPRYEDQGFYYKQLTDLTGGGKHDWIPIPLTDEAARTLVSNNKIDVNRVALGLLHTITVPTPEADFSPSLDNAEFPPVVNLPIVWNVAPPDVINETRTVGAIRIDLEVAPVEAYLVKGSAEADPLATCPRPGFGKPWSRGLSVNDPAVCTVTYNEPHLAETFSVGMVWVSTMTSNITVGESVLEVSSLESDYTADIFERHSLTTGRQ